MISAPSSRLLGFESLERETILDALPVAGAFPPWLLGSLYRNGPAKFEVGRERFRHWFDGLGMLHRFTIANGAVSYANRFLRSNAYLAATKTGRIAHGQFATKPRLGALEYVRRLRRGVDAENANVNIVAADGALLALTETPVPMAFDALTLETLGPRPFSDDLRAQTISAHPHPVAGGDVSINLATEFGRVSSYHVVELDARYRTRRIIGSLASEHPAYLHTFGLTERYALIVEFPFVLGNALDLALGRRAFIDNYRWEPGRGTRFHAMRLDDGTIAHSWHGEPFFAFHHINAYEDGNAIVLDLSAYGDASIVDELRLDNVRREETRYASAAFRRYRLDFKRNDAAYETLAPVATELPRVAPRVRARPYAYAYGLAAAPNEPQALSTTIVKVATADGTVRRWSAPACYPGEPVFVPRPGGAEEDDGVLLGVVLDASKGTSFLLALDARDMRELARANVPHCVPYGFHGTFVGA